MRAPPAVSIEARAGTVWRAFQAVLHGWAVAALGAWATQTFDAGSGGAAATGLLAVGAATFGWRRSAQPPMQISWSGAQWSVARSGEPLQATRAPEVRLDLGSWMLLRIRPQVGAKVWWVAAEQAHAAATWRQFRAAVYSSASAPEPRSVEERPPS